MSHQHLSTEAAFPSSCGSCYTSQKRRRNASVWSLSRTRAWEMEVRPQVSTCQAALQPWGQAVVFLLARSHWGGEEQTDFATPLIAVSKVFRAAKTHKWYKGTREAESSCLAWSSTGVVCLEGKRDLHEGFAGMRPFSMSSSSWKDGVGGTH